MAAELEIELKRAISIKEIIRNCQNLIGELFSVTEIPELTVDKLSFTTQTQCPLDYILYDNEIDFRILMPPEGEVSLEINLFLDKNIYQEEAGIWLCISMNPSRTNMSFFLALILALSISTHCNTNILDDSGIISSKRYISPSEIRSKILVDKNLGSVEKIADQVAEQFCVRFGGEDK